MEKTMVKTMKTPKKLAKWVSANLFAAEPIKKHKHSQGCSCLHMLTPTPDPESIGLGLKFKLHDC